MTKNKNNQAIWGTRIKDNTSNLFQKIGSSINIDKRLYKEDIAVSIAHVEMLFKQKIITFKIKNKIIYGLNKIEKEISKNKFEFNEKYEDIPTNLVKEDGAVTEHFLDYWLQQQTEYINGGFVQTELQRIASEADVDSFSSPNKEFWQLYIELDIPTARGAILKSKANGKITDENATSLLNLVRDSDITENPITLKVMTENLDYLLEIGAEKAKTYFTIVLIIQL